MELQKCETWSKHCLEEKVELLCEQRTQVLGFWMNQWIMPGKRITKRQNKNETNIHQSQPVSQ